ncbi:MAG: cobaltochelatase subunit CobN [Synechococcaceae cyanobacterium SM2_3_1]|nr:cobaltochelatase subunit CobN [Synechococcaceae cyanobacterium SM2_3_1]
MHRVATQPGGWDPNTPVAYEVNQERAEIIVLTAADTDIQVIAAARKQLPQNFTSLRVLNLLYLQHHLSVDLYADAMLTHARVILVRLLGGRSYWSYGLEILQQIHESQGTHLAIIPGDDQPDWDLVPTSSLNLATLYQIWQYFLEGGPPNLCQALCHLSNLCLGTTYPVHPPQSLPRIGLYTPSQLDPVLPHWPAVGILLYRAHVLAGNTAPVDELCRALIRLQLRPLCLYIYGWQDPELTPTITDHFQDQVEVILNTTSFSMARLDQEAPDLQLWQRLDVPVLQVICSLGNAETWQDSLQGLQARDLAMNVVLPEIDGRLITRAISFKASQQLDPDLQTEIVTYQPLPERVEFVAQMAAHWIQLRRTGAAQRRVALILANYPSRDSRLANGVGLDTPASCVQILKALAAAGYTLSDTPKPRQDLIEQLTLTVTADPMGQLTRPVGETLSWQDYQTFFASLPLPVQTAVQERWGDPPAEGEIPIPGRCYGHIFVGIQPPRGYDLDPSLNYHAPDLVPPHAYLAFYAWLRQHFHVQAVVHVGKHGNLEWLPGKSVALSASCFPEVALGPLPHLYPFIVNDPGEGAQAKRRAQAVIIDHLTPPLARAELYGPLLQLEGLIDEYVQAQQLDPQRLPHLEIQIKTLMQQENLMPETSTEGLNPDLLTQMDGYLCELKEAQIRDGLHILGQIPDPPQLAELLLALARWPGREQRGLTQALAADWGLSFDPLEADLSADLSPLDRESLSHARMPRLH